MYLQRNLGDNKSNVMLLISFKEACNIGRLGLGKFLLEIFRHTSLQGITTDTGVETHVQNMLNI
jgi:hypothetical protein